MVFCCRVAAVRHFDDENIVGVQGRLGEYENKDENTDESTPDGFSNPAYKVLLGT